VQGEFINKDIEVVDNQNKNLTSSMENVNSIKYWNKEYINKTIANIKNHKHKMFLQFLWMTGCRVSEAINIKKRDLNLNDYVVKIKWQKSKKNKERNIPLHPNLNSMLDFYSASFNLDDFLFPFSRQRAFQIVKKYFNGNPHMFRHSFAVNWIKEKGDIVILSRILGHSDIKVTMVYLNIVPRDQGEEMLKINFN